MNFLALGIAALIPLIIGIIWYNPKTFGTAWQKSAGITDEQIKGGNMPLIFGFTLLFGFLLAMMVNILVVHQMGVGSSLQNTLQNGSDEAKAAAQLILDQFSGNGIYAMEHRSFGHGAFHGVLDTIFFVLPVLGINALFEGKGAKYIFIHLGYWAITLGLMGGLICAWV
jgi:hypothetical protein